MDSQSVAKYMTLKKIIKNWILAGEIHPGEQIPTEAMLAEQFNLSRQTVRRAISELVHENVLYRVQGKGTFSMGKVLNMEEKNASHRTVAVITTYISDYIFPAIIRGIESRLSDASYSMLLFNTSNDFEKEAKAVENILQRPLDGVIIEPTKSALFNPNLRLYLRLLSKHIPIIMLHSSYTELCAPCVKMDDEKGGYLASDHLLGLGHQRVGGIFKIDDFQGRARMRGFIDAHNQHTVSPQQEWISFYTTEERETIAKKYVDLWLRASDSSRPTAVVCYNDEIAADLYAHFSESNISIPNDIAVVSFDDSAWAKTHQCTSIKHPKNEMGFQVADHVLKMIEGYHLGNWKAVSNYVFQPELVVRSSSAPEKLSDNEHTSRSAGR